eukprot:TRINITY_DN137_c0_g1_i1.p1 TRINITY_DN137_c0_g1~~TRINITY_DN137_c0_g1_i1.p1  ORF type:complete len:383 (+),score=87.74 TRINITY_DN137_c0_g1_i1:76-1149(+)
MATSSVASAIIPLPIGVVWNAIKDFTFPAKLLKSQILSAELLDSADGQSNHTRVGVIRDLTWKTGEKRKQRLLELSELTKTVRWELIESIPESEVTASISTIRLLRDTERNVTIMEWHTEFSNDCTAELIKFEQKSLEENIREIRSSLTGEETPVLFHLYQGPSSRIVWLANELGIPLNIKEVKPTDLRESQKLERSLPKGGIVTTLHHQGLQLLESGAILLYLLDRYDTQNLLSPIKGSKERALFYKFLFYAGSTVDHVVFNSYKEQFVVPADQQDEEKAEAFHNQWEEEIALEFESQLSGQPFICGSSFSVADIMIGWSLFIASLLGWLENHPILQQYLDNLSQRPAFQRAFMTQ